jgi:flavin-dependent thymidylate synthase
MKISLIDYTGHGHVNASQYAASVLIFTKNTRLQMNPGLFDEIRAWSWEMKEKELSYMANTIPSSWEFCHYTFMIEGVTRAFTHQLVRTRTASFAQQTMRVLNVEGWGWLTGPTVANHEKQLSTYNKCMDMISKTYDHLINHGAAVEDARGVLPTNILTNIVMGVNLRTLVELVRKRSSPRVQGEYRAVLDAMKAEAVRVHPWVHLFLDRDFDRAAKDLDDEIFEIEDKDKRTRMVKLVDQMRQT